MGGIIEIQRGLNDRPFTDYSDVMLDFHELKEIISEEYGDWKLALSKTKGIYLISDTNTGKQYVGSAYGQNGIWERWHQYVNTEGHGNNKILKELISGDKNYARYFRFSILRVLPSTVTDNKVIEEEQFLKKKLVTTYPLGYNDN
jgi:hypothetical protein